MRSSQRAVGTSGRYGRMPVKRTTIHRALRQLRGQQRRGGREPPKPRRTTGPKFFVWTGDARPVSVSGSRRMRRRTNARPANTSRTVAARCSHRPPRPPGSAVFESSMPHRVVSFMSTAMACGPAVASTTPRSHPRRTRSARGARQPKVGSSESLFRLDAAARQIGAVIAVFRSLLPRDLQQSRGRSVLS